MLVIRMIVVVVVVVICPCGKNNIGTSKNILAAEAKVTAAIPAISNSKKYSILPDFKTLSITFQRGEEAASESGLLKEQGNFAFVCLPACLPPPLRLSLPPHVWINATQSHTPPPFPPTPHLPPPLLRLRQQFDSHLI